MRATFGICTPRPPPVVNLGLAPPHRRRSVARRAADTWPGQDSPARKRQRRKRHPHRGRSDTPQGARCGGRRTQGGRRHPPATHGLTCPNQPGGIPCGGAKLAGRRQQGRQEAGMREAGVAMQQGQGRTSTLCVEGHMSSSFLPVKMSMAVKLHLAWPCLPVLEVDTSTTCTARLRVGDCSRHRRDQQACALPKAPRQGGTPQACPAGPCLQEATGSCCVLRRWRGQRPLRHHDVRYVRGTSVNKYSASSQCLAHG